MGSDIRALAGKRVVVTIETGNWRISDDEDRVSAVNTDESNYTIMMEKSQRLIEISKDAVKEVVELEDCVQVILNDGCKILFGFDLTSEAL